MLRGPIDKALYADSGSPINSTPVNGLGVGGEVNRGGHNGGAITPNGGGSFVSAQSSGATPGTAMFSLPNVGSSFELA